jgi:hypothetical protein
MSDKQTSWNACEGALQEIAAGIDPETALRKWVTSEYGPEGAEAFDCLADKTARRLVNKAVYAAESMSRNMARLEKSLADAIEGR